MSDFIEIKCLTPEEVRSVMEEIERRITAKKKEGVFTDREIREIEEMRLRPIPDILDIQSVYENHLYKPKG